MSDEKTIAALKTNFLRQQIRILSQPLKLSDKAKERAELSDGDLRDVMLRTNQIVRRHHHSVYDRVAISSVAAQIEQLFWYASEPEDLLTGQSDAGIPRIGDDLTDVENMQKLSSMLEDQDTTEDFAAALSRLQELSERRGAMRRKLEQYKKLQELLQPLKDAKKNVQLDLVTKDGVLTEELARMKALSIRVAGGIARRNERGDGIGIRGDEDEDVLMLDESAKVSVILGRR